MCLAIPSKITQIKNNMATIDVDGVQREASLLLLENAAVGDYVIVHAGFAIQKIDEAAAMETLNLLKEAAALVEGGGSGMPEEGRASLPRGRVAARLLRQRRARLPLWERICLRRLQRRRQRPRRPRSLSQVPQPVRRVRHER